MTIDALLARLDAVRVRGAGHWSARCPVPSHGQGHGDRSPSLSVAEGDRGILLRCWAGCSLSEITAALGLGLRDLFPDAGDAPRERPADLRARREAAQRRARERYDWRRTAGQFEDHATDLWLRAERVLSAAQGLDPSGWSDEDLDAAMKAVSRAYADQEWAQILAEVAVRLRMPHIRHAVAGRPDLLARYESGPDGETIIATEETERRAAA